MVPQVSGSLAKIVSTNPAGSRLRLLHPVRALEPAVRGWPFAGLIMAGALTSFVMLTTAILSISIGWHVLLAIFVGLYIAIVTLGIVPGSKS